MPYGADIRGRNRQGGRGRFPGPGFPGIRTPMRRFPRFYFSPIFGAPRRRCEHTDRYGRCCDRYGRCYNDGFGRGLPFTGGNDFREGRYDSRSRGTEAYRRYGRY